MKPPRIFMLLTILLFCIIVILPIASMIIASFSGSTWEDWYHSLKVFDKRQILLAENSLTLGLGSTCLCLIIGVPLAILLGRTDLWGGRLFNIIYIVPIIIPAYIQAIVWTRIDPFLQKVFSFDVHSVWGCTIVLALSYFPLVTLMTLSGLKSIDRGLEEAALLCYGKFRTLAKITIPLVAPHIFSGAIFVFILSSVNFAVPDILRVRVYPVEIFVQFSAFYNEKAATLLCLPFLVFACLLIVLQKWWMR
ncbi:MAG: ABC transporter permease subunit, partial [Nitrospiraceae bacterium]|nr:ABC transporter permease subunit [Nitrospiraceae bacterium]